MHCDVCGNLIPKGQSTQDLKGERINNQGPSLPTRWRADPGRRYKMVVINICPDCVKARDRREAWMWFWLAFFGLALIGRIVFNVIRSTLS